MKLSLLVLLFIFFLKLTAYTATSFIFPRTPAPSPDGSQIAFSFQGDIWVVPTQGGEARRLTANPAYDYRPHWSPDGRQIVFSSDRYGNDDVFVLSLDGGPLKRLTYFSNSDAVWQWLPNGREIIFSSRRDFYYHRLPLMYKVSIDGGTPFEIIPEYADQGKMSPNGRYLVFVKGRTDIFRKGYRGSSNTDIFLYDFKEKKYSKLTNFEGNDMFPLWGPDSRTIYFVSDKDGTMNLYRMVIDGSGKTQLTFFKEDGIRFPEISRDGKIIAFERQFDLYRYEVASGKVSKMDIHLPVDYVNNPVIYKNYSGNATEFTVSPDGKLAAFVVRGEIFVINENGRFLKQITESPWRDDQVTWAPNSDSLVFVSDREGSRDIYMVTSGDPQQKMLSRTTRLKTVKLIGGKSEEHSPQFSPDGRKLAFIRGKGDLVIYDFKERKERTVLKGWAEPDFAWSPDSRWLAYSVEDNEFNSDIFLLNLETGEKYNVSQHPDYDLTPRWSADGKRLAFISKRIGDNYDIWMVFLRKVDEERTDEEWEEIFTDKKKEKEKSDSLRVIIDDPEHLYKRLRRVTSLPGVEGDFDWSPDGQFIVFNSNTAGKSDLWKIKWNGKELKQLTSTDERPEKIRWHVRNKKIYYLKKGGRLASITPDGSKAKTINFSTKLKIDIIGEQKQKFSECWRTLNDHFYDPAFHGTNWKAMYDKYQVAAESVFTIRDFNDVIRMMLGELNASHLGIYSPQQPDAVSSGMLGLRFDPEYEGDGLRIKEVIPHGPADRVREPAVVGEILLAVNGNLVSSKTNLYSLLENKVNNPVELLLSGKKKGSEYRRTIVVRPVNYGQFLSLEYDRWREEKAEMVHNLSKNKLGYIHIRAMAEESLERFEMELYAEAHDKEGLIIDVRNNGGGWTADYLLNMLMIPNHAVTVPRDGGEGYPQGRRPLYAWTKPIAVLCNEYSFSNAEIFSHAIKTLKRGKLIGKPTGGLVISTGSIRLIDGSTFRVPFRGWYVKGSGVNMENNGAIPDIIVEDLPGDVAVHKDRQLEVAVKELMKEIR